MAMKPSSTRSRWLIERSRVDLPEPDWPMIAVTLPGRSDRLTSSSTLSGPKLFETWLMRISPPLRGESVASEAVRGAAEACVGAAKPALAVVVVARFRPSQRRAVSMADGGGLRRAPRA